MKRLTDNRDCQRRFLCGSKVISGQGKFILTRYFFTALYGPS
jgi:hypothetical protein